VKSTNLDKRVQVSHSFIIRVLGIDLPLVRDATRVALISSRSFFWASGCLVSSRNAKVNVWVLVSSEEIDWSGNVMQAGLVTAYVQQ